MRAWHRMLAPSLAALSAILAAPSAYAQNVLVTQLNWEPTFVAQRLTDLTPGSGDSLDYTGLPYPSMAVYDDALYFHGTDGQSGAELWRFDGEDITRVEDIFPGPEGSFPGHFAVYDGSLYFTARAPTSGLELMRYDGTAVTLAADIATGSRSGAPTGKEAHGGKLYFVANDGLRGAELWQFDGSAATIVRDLHPGPIGAFETGTLTSSYHRCCASYGDRLFFYADRGDGAGEEPHVLHGETLARIANIAPGAAGSSPSGQKPLDTAELNGTLYFPAQDTAGHLLWRYDGATVSLAADPEAGTNYLIPRDLTVFKNALFFAAATGSGGSELMRFTEADGVTVAAEQAGQPSYNPGRMAVVTPDRTSGEHDPDPQPWLFFAGTCCDTDPGPLYNVDRELFAYDGTRARMAANINQRQTDVTAWPSVMKGQSNPRKLTAWGDWVYFYAQTVEHGYELWRAKPARKMNVYIAIGLLADRWWEWPIDWIEQPVVMAVYAVTSERSRRLVYRKVLKSGRLDLTGDGTTLGLQLDPSRLAQSFALSTLLFSARDGKLLSQGIAAYGAKTAAEGRRLEAAAAKSLERLDLRRVRSDKVTRGIASEIARRPKNKRGSRQQPPLSATDSKSTDPE
ncbi:MAG: hypothetical protein ACE5GX_18110 [Thermoanaerobaculia bacterium]